MEWNSSSFGISNGEKCVPIYDALQWFIWKSTIANCYSPALVRSHRIPIHLSHAILFFVHRNAVTDFGNNAKSSSEIEKKGGKSSKQWHLLWAIELNGMEFAMLVPNQRLNERVPFAGVYVNDPNWFSMRKHPVDGTLNSFAKSRNAYNNSKWII